MNPIRNYKVLSLENNDFALVDSPLLGIFIGHPFIIENTIVCLCTSGTADCILNLRHISVQPLSFFDIEAGSAFQCNSVSQDFMCKNIVMSRRFFDKMGFDDKANTISMSIRDNPCVSLRQEGMDALLKFFYEAEAILKLEDNPYQEEIILNLTRAFFYSFGYYLHKQTFQPQNVSYSPITIKLLSLIRDNFREHRDSAFYADKMCLTSKHISKIIKAETGRSLTNWIEQYMVLEAKALLKSTDMSVSQISEVLNFPSQSFFGKYFKRITGLSPLEYRK